jgi:hypothetical protein
MAPVYTDEVVSVELEVIEVLEKGRVRISTDLRKENGSQAVTGHAIVIVRPDPPLKRIIREDIQIGWRYFCWSTDKESIER